MAIYNTVIPLSKFLSYSFLCCWYPHHSHHQIPLALSVDTKVQQRPQQHCRKWDFLSCFNTSHQHLPVWDFHDCSLMFKFVFSLIPISFPGMLQAIFLYFGISFLFHKCGTWHMFLFISYYSFLDHFLQFLKIIRSLILTFKVHLGLSTNFMSEFFVKSYRSLIKKLNRTGPRTHASRTPVKITSQSDSAPLPPTLQ